MIHWTITPEVEHPDVPGSLFYEVNGEGDDPESPHQDPHDARHLPDLYAAVSYVVRHHMKRGDTLKLAGPDTGRILRVGYVLCGENNDRIEFDVGTMQLPDPNSLVDWMVATLKPGDTISYLPHEDVMQNASPE